MTPELLDPPTDPEPTDDHPDGPTDAADGADGPADADGAGPSKEATTDGGSIAVETGAGTATLSVPPTATKAEAAAVAAAVSAHLEADDAEAEPEPAVDRWKLSARLGRNGLGRKRARSQRGTAGGNEWKFATRAW